MPSWLSLSRMGGAGQDAGEMLDQERQEVGWRKGRAFWIS